MKKRTIAKTGATMLTMAMLLNGTTVFTDNEYKVSGAIEKTDTDQIDISFLNKRSGVIPTGVIMTVAPFAAVTLLGAAGMVTIKMRKKEDDAE